MGDRIAGLSAGLVMAALMLTILVVLAGAFLVLLVSSVYPSESTQYIAPSSTN